MSDQKLDHDRLQKLARMQSKERGDNRWDDGAKDGVLAEAEKMVDAAARVGYDPIRQMTYIKHRADRVPDRTEIRCETCGRTEECACGLQCPCPVSKAGMMSSDVTS